MPVVPSLRFVPAVLLGAYLAVVMVILLWADGSAPTRVVAWAAACLGQVATTGQPLGGARLEFILNAAMFVPMAVLARITFPRHPWANWVVYGFVISLTAETVQGLWLPRRSAQHVDVVANTAGMLVGAVMSLLVGKGHNFRPTSTKPER